MKTTENLIGADITTVFLLSKAREMHYARYDEDCQMLLEDLYYRYTSQSGPSRFHRPCRKIDKRCKALENAKGNMDQ